MTEIYDYSDLCEQYVKGFIEATIDTESTLSLEMQKRRETGKICWTPRLSIGMSKGNAKAFLEKFKEVCGDIGSEVFPEHWKDKYGNKLILWRYKVQGRELRTLLNNINLVIKEEQRLLLLEAMELLYNRTTHTISDNLENQLFELYLESLTLNAPQSGKTLRNGGS